MVLSDRRVLLEAQPDQRGQMVLLAHRDQQAHMEFKACPGRKVFKVFKVPSGPSGAGATGPTGP